MKAEKLSFEMDLWGQCDKLHERLNKKISYYKVLVKSLDPFYEIFNDISKKLNSLKISMDPTISHSLYTDDSDSTKTNLYGIALTIEMFRDFLAKIMEYNTQTIFHISKGLEDLIKKVQTEKSEYDNFIKCRKNLSENKAIMDKNMKLYHQKMLAAESAVLDLKNFEIIKLSVNNDTSLIENKNLLEEKAVQLTNDSVKPFKMYSDSVDKVNEIRVESIELQKHLLYKYQNIEEEVGKSNISFANLIFSIEKIIKELLDKTISETQNNIKNININKDIKQLILDYKGNEKPEKNILFINFPSSINFDEGEDNKSFEINKKSVEFIKERIESEYPNYAPELEIEKNDMREILYKLFETYEQEKADKLMSFIKNSKTHRFFLILLSKLRTRNRYLQTKIMIDLLGKILNNILNESEKYKIYDNAKNCIILSQTFYYKNNDEKFYLLNHIKNHKWLKSVDYWINFGELMIDAEMDKLLENYPDLTKNDIITNSDKITVNLRKKINDIIYSQILPFVNNMNEFKLGYKDIVEITEGILTQYPFLNDEQKDIVYGFISENKEEMDKLRKEYYENHIKKKEELNKNKEIKINKCQTMKENDIKPLLKSNNENSIPEKEKEQNISKVNKENKENPFPEKDKNISKINHEKPLPEKDKNESKKNINNNNKANEIEYKINQNIMKNSNNIVKNKDKKDNQDKIKTKEVPIDLPRSISISLPLPKKFQNQENSENVGGGGGFFKNIKSKFTNKEKEEEKKLKNIDVKNQSKKEDKKIKNNETTNQVKKEIEKKMIKFDPNKDKIHQLKPVPKENHNIKTNISENQKTNANPFGVVLKKINKTKDEK